MYALCSIKCMGTVKVQDLCSLLTQSLDTEYYIDKGPDQTVNVQADLGFQYSHMIQNFFHSTS